MLNNDKVMGMTIFKALALSPISHLGMKGIYHIPSHKKIRYDVERDEFRVRENQEKDFAQLTGWLPMYHFRNKKGEILEMHVHDTFFSGYQLDQLVWWIGIRWKKKFKIAIDEGIVY